MLALLLVWACSWTGCWNGAFHKLFCCCFAAFWFTFSSTKSKRDELFTGGFGTTFWVWAGIKLALGVSSFFSPGLGSLKFLSSGLGSILLIVIIIKEKRLI